MASSSPSSPPVLDSCQESNPSDPAARCGAALAAHDRCIAHLDPNQLTAFLATLGPGSDIDMQRVTFPPGLLEKVLDSLRPGTNRFATFGSANFRGATFSDGFFYRVNFPEGANFDET